MIEQHFTPAEVADLLAVSESTVLRACRQGRLESLRVLVEAVLPEPPE